MDKIFIGLYSEHKLLNDALNSLISTTKGLEISLRESSLDRLEGVKLEGINILILHKHTLDGAFMSYMKRAISKYPRLRVLILSEEENEGNILKTIKAGAKGFLAKDSDSGDLLEAIYTLRAGHDYYSKSITQLLLKKYIVDLKSGGSSGDSDISSLSNRELEVLKLWGNSYTNKEISDELYISVRTVESHKNHIMQKLNMKTAVDLVKFAIRNNIIEV